MSYKSKKNIVAKALAKPQFRQRIVKSKKAYTRKEKHNSFRP